MERTDGNVVSPVVCVNAAGKVGRRFPSRGTIHLQKFLEITSRAKAQWRRRREGSEAKERWRIDTGFEEKTKRVGGRVRTEREREREINLELLLISAESGAAVNLGGDRNLRTEESCPALRKIHKQIAICLRRSRSRVRLRRDCTRA